MELKLTNNLTKTVTTLSEIEDKLDSRLFYSFDIQITEDMEEGEYTYELFEDGILKAQGLLQVGNYERDNKEYTDNNGKTYIVYDGK